VGDVTVCHHSYERTPRRGKRAEDDRTDAANDEWTPEAFEEDDDVDVELLTDGGDE